MASIRESYRGKRIIIITAPNSAVCQFEHNDRVYKQKFKELRGAGNAVPVVTELYRAACKEIDKLLGPVEEERAA